MIYKMKLLYALLVIFWWLSIWGLFELYIEHETKAIKTKIYVGIITIILIILYAKPHILDYII